MPNTVSFGFALALAAASAAIAQPPPPMPGVPPVFAANPAGGYLGIGVQEINAERAKDLKLTEEHGAEVTRVAQGSPAERAGLKKGDVVLEYQGERVEGVDQFVRLVRETPAGRNVKLRVSRDGRLENLAVTIAPMPAPGLTRAQVFRPPFESASGWLGPTSGPFPVFARPIMSWPSPSLGVEAEAVADQLAQYFGVTAGILIRSVSPDSPAAQAGLKAGDVIVKAGQTAVTSPAELASALEAATASQSLPLTIVRDRKETALTVFLDPNRPRPGPRRRGGNVRHNERFR